MSYEVDLSGIDLSVLQKALTPRMTKYIPITPTPKQTAFLLMNDKREILYGGQAPLAEANPLHSQQLLCSMQMYLVIQLFCSEELMQTYRCQEH